MNTACVFDVFELSGEAVDLLEDVELGGGKT